LITRFYILKFNPNINRLYEKDIKADKEVYLYREISKGQTVIVEFV